MDYLGLGPDDAYDDYDASVAVERPQRQAPRDRVREPRGRRFVEDEDDYDDQYDDYGDPSLPVRRAPVRRDDSSVTVRPTAGSGPTVRPLTASSAVPVTIRPVEYDEARDIADMVKSGTPVLMDIGSAEEHIARRLIDFVSGLVYGSEGTLEKVSPGVFLIKPRGVRVARG
jgi:cell division inhibitor SepF